MNQSRISVVALVLLMFLSHCNALPQQKASSEAKDVIKVMTYNVLRYGDGCQGPTRTMHGYLKNIVGYTNPDIVGLIKVAAMTEIKDESQGAFTDSILSDALNAEHPQKYAYCVCPQTGKNKERNLLFYNKQKLGYSSSVNLLSDVTDFNVYKLFYLKPDLSKTHDTNFLYIILVHTDSGDEPDKRDRQMSELMKQLKKQYPTLPNMIVMGDFNLRKTNEEGYQVLTNNTDNNYHFLDPPFAIDKKASYPANWDKHPEKYAAYLTTSTRKKDNEPNKCGTGGGAKGWYDHILISPSLADNGGYFHYINGTYHTVANDGHRIGVSATKLPNNAAPAAVLNAVYQMSNKYPVVLELGITR